MRVSKLVAGLAAVSVLGLGLFAGSVIGSDGGVDTASRLTGDFGTPQPVKLHFGPTTFARAKHKHKPKVIYGRSSSRSIAAGDSDLASVKCPKKYPVPLSVGLDSSGPGIFPGILAHPTVPNSDRSMNAAAVNMTSSPGQWVVTAVCAKGVAQG